MEKAKKKTPPGKEETRRRENEAVIRARWGRQGSAALFHTQKMLKCRVLCEKLLI